MLRRLKPISLAADDIVSEPEPTVAPIPQREDERSPYATGAQLRMDLDSLRAEAQRNMVTEDEPRNFSPRRFFNPRIMLMVVAVLAGGLAAWLAVQRFTPPEAPAAEATIAPVAAPAPVMTKVLVATTAIGAGQRLSETTISWQEWPQANLRPEFITDAATPEAATDMSGAIARLEFFPGEPIRREKLIMEGDGYLSAILAPGKRAVSVSITAAAASGGFILPNDHVDVMLARTLSDGRQVSDTVLTNVRVMAINSQLGDTTNNPDSPDGPATTPAAFTEATLAILELAPTEAEVIVNAATMGPLALVLRPLTDNAEPTEGATLNQAIRMSSPFWQH
ncbi:MAG: Flp pilus assembly protein CpaB [Devosia sp.]